MEGREIAKGRGGAPLVKSVRGTRARWAPRGLKTQCFAKASKRMNKIKGEVSPSSGVRQGEGGRDFPRCEAQAQKKRSP